jgi:hypothetical protein
MAIQNTGTADFNNIGVDALAAAGGNSEQAEWALYDRARSSDAHVVLDFDNKITPIGYFEKFDVKSRSEIIYRHPIGSKVPIGEHKPGGWDLTFNNGLIDDRLWSVHDTITKTKFDGDATPRLTVVQRVTLTHNKNASTVKKNLLYIFWQTVLGGYELSDPGEGNPLEESCTGYARFRTEDV